MNLTRRATLSFACFAFLPSPLLAAGCEPILPALSLCDASGWRLASVTDDTATLTSDAGMTATIRFRTGLSEEELSSDRWMASHAPISARAQVLEVAFDEIDGRLSTTAAYLPRHFSPPAVVALTDYQGSGASLSVSTQSPGETYSDTHRQAHTGLLAALRLDLPE